MKGQDWYETQLDRDDLDPATRQQYEAEADRLAAGLTRQQDALTQRQRVKAARIAEIRALLESGRTDAVDLYGLEEFGQDYTTEVDEFGIYQVRSFVARDGQPDQWSFDDEEGARRCLHGLIWDRMYTKYVRSGKVDGLYELPDFV